MPSRRGLLRVGGTIGLGVLAGCSRLPLVSGPTLSLVFRNEMQREVEPIVELIRPNGREYSEATVYGESIPVPASAERTGDPGRRTVNDVAPARSYRVRIWFGDTIGEPAIDYRYYPDCDAGLPGDEKEVTPQLVIDLYRTEDDEGGATIHQSRCSDNSRWL